VSFFFTKLDAVEMLLDSGLHKSTTDTDIKLRMSLYFQIQA